jgi:hypothetical protein
MPVPGWCRCGSHAGLIEGFLSDYGLRYDEEGWVVDMLEEEEEEGTGVSGHVVCTWFGIV